MTRAALALIVLLLAQVSAGAQSVAGRSPTKANGGSVADAVLSQMIGNRCWSSSTELPDSKRLRAVIGVRFRRDGHFLEPPTLIDPATLPSSDPVLEVFVRRALASLDKCNRIGFQVPEDYFTSDAPPVIEFDFRASVGN